MSRAVVFAYHDVGCMGIRVLKRLGIDVARVYTHEDDPGENHWFGSVRKTCAELGVPCSIADPHLPEELARMRAFAPDAIFSLYYRNMLKDSVLEIPRHGAVNLHGSYLPRYRGRAPVNWMILHGETQGGVTLHYMVRKPDAGDIVDQESFEIGEDETAVDVYKKMLPAAEGVLLRSAEAVLKGTARRVLQMESKASYYGRRRPEDGRIEWRWCAEDVRNLVRAVTHPYPGAFTFAGGAKVTVWRADFQRPRPDGGDGRGIITTPYRAVAGTVVVRGTVYVVCGDGTMLSLDRVEIDGREGDATDFPDVLKDGLVLGGS